VPPPGYLDVPGIGSALVHLANTHPSFCQLIPLPETSHQGETIRAVRIGRGRGRGRNGVLLIGGVHAREIVNPDLLISLAYDLCIAFAANTGLIYGPRSYSAASIRLMVQTMDIFILPLVNPDGRNFVFSAPANAMWRKNRSPNPGMPCMGVDLNRNYDFLWSSGIGTSASSCSEVFKGAGAFSEPETRNVRHLLDEFPQIGCMVDVHSYTELVLYPWGDDTSQTTNPAMNFMNPAFNGLRGDPTNPVYQEYIPQADLNRFVATGTKMRDAIAAVRGRFYTVKPSVLLYPTTGTSNDYAYSRHFVDASKRRVCAYVLETAREFQPPWSEALDVISEVSSGLVQFCLSCNCLVERTVGRTSLSRELDAMRGFRDERMLATSAGQRYLALLEENAGEIEELMEADAALRRRALEVLRRVNEVTKDESGKRTFTPTLIAAMEKLFGQFAERASPQLRAAIEEVGRDLEHFRGADAVTGLDAASKRESPGSQRRR
jgi:carboxypeptidase T